MKTTRRISKALLGVSLIFLLAFALAGHAVAQPDYTAWVDLGIVYSESSGGDAYYPSVIYDANGFGTGIPLYKMWYSDGSGNVFLVTSTNGNASSWGTPTSNSRLGGDAHHVQVVYDANCFATSCGAGDPKYKIWYWDTGELYSINAIAYAESSDGVSWSNDQAVTQDTTNKLVTGVYPNWNYGSYGPIDVIYQPGALNTGTDPWSYSYVMYYDGTDGGREFTGLAYSSDGKAWTAYGSNPVLNGSSTAA